MTPFLLDLLCDPRTQAPLELHDAVRDASGDIRSGRLVSSIDSGRVFPIVNGVPRFVADAPAASVTAFGDEWNHFNFVDFRANWLEHTVRNTFGSPDAFAGRIIVDAGGGSGAQTRWFAELGAKHVVMLDLSHSVDEVAQRNLAGLANVDVVQASIDEPPIRRGSIPGIVYCHNVIQHTPSVERTAHALYALLAPGGEFVFNCYRRDVASLAWMARHYLVCRNLRAVLSRLPFPVVAGYAYTLSALRFLPVAGPLLEKSLLMVRGDVPRVPGETRWQRVRRLFKAGALNTCDWYGPHTYQHYKSDAEIRSLLDALAPAPARTRNMDRYFSRPMPIGCALRVER